MAPLYPTHQEPGARDDDAQVDVDRTRASRLERHFFHLDGRCFVQQQHELPKIFFHRATEQLDDGSQVRIAGTDKSLGHATKVRLRDSVQVSNRRRLHDARDSRREEMRSPSHCFPRASC